MYHTSTVRKKNKELNLSGPIFSFSILPIEKFGKIIYKIEYYYLQVHKLNNCAKLHKFIVPLLSELTI